MPTNTGKLGRWIVMIVLTAFFNGNLFGQKSYNSYELASAFPDHFRNSKSEILKAVALSSTNETYTLDATLDFEHWMTHPAEWSINLESGNMSEMFVEAEMNFESWMFNTGWSAEETFVEKEIDFESWMTAPALWLNK